MNKFSVNLEFENDITEKIMGIVKHENITIDNLFTDIIVKYIKENKLFHASKFDGLWRWIYSGLKKDYLFNGYIWTEINNEGNGEIKGIFTYDDKNITLKITHLFNVSTNEWGKVKEKIYKKIKYKLENNSLFFKETGLNEHEYKRVENS